MNMTLDELRKKRDEWAKKVEAMQAAIERAPRKRASKAKDDEATNTPYFANSSIETAPPHISATSADVTEPTPESVAYDAEFGASASEDLLSFAKALAKSPSQVVSTKGNRLCELLSRHENTATWKANVYAAIQEAGGAKRCETCGNFVTIDGGTGHKPQCKAAGLARNSEHSNSVKPIRSGVTFSPETADDWGEHGGAKTKFRANMDALLLAKKIKEEGRQATPEEQKIIARFVSWGGIPGPFDPRHERYTLAESIENHGKKWSLKPAEAERNFFASWNNILSSLSPSQAGMVREWLSNRGLRYWYAAPSKNELDAFKAWFVTTERSEWSEERREIKQILSPEELNEAARTITNAHYTTKEVVDAIWSNVAHLGFSGGRVLEPAVGKGNFIMAMPEEFREKSAVIGVDYDKTSADVASLLCQQADIRHGAYQETPLPKNYFDLVVSNVPFGKIGVFDREFDGDGTNELISSGKLPSVHNYYFAKALRQVKPGGLIAFVTSRHTMDSPSAENLRAFLAQEADLVGAMRLPNTSFKHNAGTEVTTDVIYLRKRYPGEEAGDQSWVKTSEQIGADGVAFQLNNYYTANPEHMLGKMMGGTGSMYQSGEPTLESDGRNLGEAIREIGSTFEAGVMAKKRAYNCPSCGNFIGEDGTGHKETCRLHSGHASLPNKPADTREVVFDGEIRLGDDGKTVFLREKGEWIVHPKTGEKKKDGSPSTASQKIVLLAAVRAKLKKVVEANRNNATDEELLSAQAELNKEYDAFVALFGPISKPTNARLLGGDPYMARMMALEVYDKETETAEKQPIFSKRLFRVAVDKVQIENAQDAFVACMNDLGRFDFQYIARMLPGRTEESVQAELEKEGLVFFVNGRWEARDEFLSGNVRRKLATIKEQAVLEPDRYRRYIEELEAVQPPLLSHDDIDVALGQSWIPEDVVQDFVNATLKPNSPYNVRFNPKTGLWTVSKPNWRDSISTENVVMYGTKDFSAIEIIEAVLNFKPVEVHDTVDVGDGKTKRVLNQGATALAQDKAEAIENEFRRYLFDSDASRRDTLVSLYNEKVNTEVPRQWRHPGLTLPGMSMEIPPLYESQKNAIWRIMQGQNTGLFHSVGFGKTFTMIGAGAELRRIGARKKVMHAVPNNMLRQYTADIYRMYPDAKVLSISSKVIENAPGKTTAEKRKYIFAMAAQGDWDAIVVTHSALGKIPMSLETQKQFIEDRIAEYSSALEMAVAIEGNKSLSAKDLQKKLENERTRLKALMNKMAQRQDDTTVTWEDIGVDQLFVDEADLFKNLPFATRLKLPGIQGASSQRAEDLFMKIRSMQQRCHKCGKFVPARNSNCRHCLAPRAEVQTASVVLATGTPISNTLSEMYNMQKFLDYDGLKEDGFLPFDIWAKQFVKAVTAIEMNPTGSGYRLATRFSQYQNLPELKSRFMRVADIQQNPDIVGVSRPDVYGGRPTARSVKSSRALKMLIQDLVRRSDRLPHVKPTEDNMLMITNDGRKAAIDLRLVKDEMDAIYETIDGRLRAFEATILSAETAVQKARAEISAHKQRGGDSETESKLSGELAEAEQYLSSVMEERDHYVESEREMIELARNNWDNPESKINQSIKGVAKFLAENTGVFVPNIQGDPALEGRQNLSAVMFLDNGTPGSPGVNLYDDIRRKLEDGVEVELSDGTKTIYRAKPGEVAFAHEYDTDEKKLELTEAVNRGRVRLVIGSTSKLGAGTNMQRRLGLLVHLDTPWRPRDVEQREGRIARSGNSSWLPDAGVTHRCKSCGNFVSHDGVHGHKKTCQSFGTADNLEQAPWFNDEYVNMNTAQKENAQRAWFNSVAEPAAIAYEKLQAATQRVRDIAQKMAEPNASRGLAEQLEAATAEQNAAQDEFDKAREARRVAFSAWAKPRPKIERWVTEESFDVYSWQGNERKALFIAQGINTDLTTRRVADDPMALSAAEVKALATGDERIINRIALEREVKKLEGASSSFHKARLEAQRELNALPKKIADTENVLDGVRSVHNAISEGKEAEAQRSAHLASELEQCKDELKALNDVFNEASKKAKKAEKEGKQDAFDEESSIASRARNDIDKLKERMAAIRDEMERLSKPHAVIGGRECVGQEKLSAALFEAETKLFSTTSGEWVRLGQYMGVPLVGYHHGFGACSIAFEVNGVRLKIAGGPDVRNRVFENSENSASVLRSAVVKISDTITENESVIDRLKSKKSSLEIAAKQEFPRQAELEAKRKELSDIEAILSASDVKQVVSETDFAQEQSSDEVDVVEATEEDE